MQTFIAIFSLVFLAILLLLLGYALGRASVKKKKNAGIDTPQSTAVSDGDSW